MALSDKEINELREQVRREYQLSFNTIVKKRMQFRRQDELLNGIVDQDKIDTKTLFYTLYSKMALVYSDDVQVKFEPRQMSGVQQSHNLNKLARYDYDEMDMGVQTYEVQLNRFMRGVGIRLMTGWDDVRQVPTWQVMDTRTWVPDPRGWFDPKGFRYHGFELSEFKYNLREEDGFFDVDKCTVAESPETVLNRVYAQKAANLFPATDQLLQTDSENAEIAVYYHMTRFNGKPVFTVWGNNIGTLIKYEEIKPVYSEEKKDVLEIPFPVVLNYFYPRKGDPYGTSLADLVQVPHRYKNVLANLMFIREKDLALGDDVIYDTNVIKNKNDLSTPTLSRKFIGADGSMGNISNAVSIIPKNPSSGATYSFMDKLDSMVSLASGMDARQMGISGGANVTLGEAQQIQANNNVKSLFEIRINSQGEKQFWKLWYRAYRENFGSGEKKVIRVTNSLGSQNIEFEKEDILGTADPDVKVTSKTELANERAQKMANLTPLLIATMNNPAKPAIARAMAERKLYELNDVTEDEQFVYVPPSWEELDARDKLPLLNWNDPDGVKIAPEEMGADHMTYITVFGQALPTPATKAAIEARKRALIMQGINGMNQAPAQEGTGQAAQNMMLQNANSANQQASQIQTRQNVVS